MNSKYFQGLGDFHAGRSCSTPPLPAGRITVLQAVATWREHFIKRGVTEPEHSSQYIISHLLGAKTVSFYSCLHVCCYCCLCKRMASLPSPTHWHPLITQMESLRKGQLTQFLDKKQTQQIWQLCTKRLSRYSFSHHLFVLQLCTRVLYTYLYTFVQDACAVCD